MGTIEWAEDWQKAEEMAMTWQKSSVGSAPRARLAGSWLTTGIKVVQRQWNPLFPSHIPSEPQASASS